MKYLLLCISIVISGCGVSETLSKGCGGDLDRLCDMLFGQDPDKIEEFESRLDRIEEEVHNLKLEVNSINNDILMLENEFLSNNRRDDEVVSRIDDLELLMHEKFSELTELITDTENTTTIDPCGPNDGYDEVVLRLPNGSLVGYFRENGRYEFLKVLTSGMYVTTDTQRCKFAVDKNGNVHW